jgi:hypothetical protein
LVESASVENHIQTPVGLLPSGTIAGDNWEMFVADHGCISFKRSDWKKAVLVPITRLRAFVLA